MADTIPGTQHSMECPVCGDPLECRLQERKQQVMTGHSVGASPQPFEKVIEHWTTVLAYSCGMRVQFVEDGSANANALGPCSNATAQALKLADENNKLIGENTKLKEALEREAARGAEH